MALVCHGFYCDSDADRDCPDCGVRLCNECHQDPEQHEFGCDKARVIIEEQIENERGY